MKTRVPIRLVIQPPPAAACLIALATFAPLQSFCQTSQSALSSSQPAPVVLDRAVAVVNKQVILLSDLQDEIHLSILEPNRSGGQLTPPVALDDLISRTLIEQQIREEDEAALTPTQDEVNARIEDLRKQLPVCIRQDCATDAGWNAFLAAHQLTPRRVERYVRHRMEILRFIEQRFRQGIQISQEQIQAYYRDILLPEYRPGETPPPLDQVASRIQEILLQQQVNQLFDNWLTNLRRQGDVEVLDPALETANANGQGSANQ
jgi:peptidyl-prolyl cis-trans isomerase SurA